MKRFWAVFSLLLLAGCSNSGSTVYSTPTVDDTVVETAPVDDPLAELFRQLDTDRTQTLIDLDLVVSGGTGKDGIPALDDPKFYTIAEASADLMDDSLGIYVDVRGDQRYYPYSILVWHEIINDELSGDPVAITFCPLCGSAMVFDRRVGEDVLEFGVSGLLYESNLLMYDHETESLWSQALGQAVVGDYSGTELTRLPMQRLTFAELKLNYPNAQVMTPDTGYDRDYGVDPYLDYDGSDELLFPVTVDDQRYPLKTIMYVVPIGEQSVAFPLDQLPARKAASIDINDLELEVERENGVVLATYDDEPVTGYFEMWFSWATHHQADGIVWTPEL
jgi:hypothetical protein